MILRALSIALGVIARNVITHAHIGIANTGLLSKILRPLLFE
jgi:hypothetical protein